MFLKSSLGFYGMIPNLSHCLRSLTPLKPFWGLVNPPGCEGLSHYQQWQQRFMKVRLQLALWIALGFIFSVITLNGMRFWRLEEPLWDYQLGTQVAIALSLLTSLRLLPLASTHRHLNVLFLLFSWSLTLFPLVSNTVNPASEIDFSGLIITFFTQATLISVRWRLHLFAQGVMVGFYALFYSMEHEASFFSVLDSSLQVPMVLILFWVCLICDFSVYLYERLQQSEFKSRRQLEMAYQDLEKAERQYRSIFENAIEGIFQSSPEGQYLSVNPSLAHIYGYDSPEELTNLTDISQMYVDPHRRQEFMELIREQGQVIGFESQIYRRDRQIIWICENARVITNHRGEIIAYEGTVEDITRRKSMEEDMRKNWEREKELNQLKSRFIAMASHEFRTPLTRILASAEALEHYQSQWDSSKQLKYLQRIQITVNHLNCLLNNILIMGRSDSDKLPINPHKVDLYQLCQNLIEETSSCLTPKHHLKFLTDGTPEPLEVYLDESLLRQILENLLSNAIKYSPHGGEIKLRIEYNTDKVCFQIQDSGIGIPEEDLGYLFQSFHRGHNVGNLPGTGLGLAIVKKAVDLQQGEITVESSPDQGSLFSVTLPLYH